MRELPEASTMSALRFALHHPWLVGAAILLVGVAALIFRRRVARALKLAKAAATDPRLPRHVRWLFRVALLAKALPVDFGIDEAALALGVALLLLRHRETWREICAEIQ